MAAASDWTVPPPPYARWLNEAFPNVKSPPPRRYRLPFNVLPWRVPVANTRVVSRAPLPRRMRAVEVVNNFISEAVGSAVPARSENMTWPLPRSTTKAASLCGPCAIWAAIADRERGLVVQCLTDCR